MLAQQRQSLILDRIRRAGSVRVSDLTEELSVSDMTVRRDLDALARRGLVEKVHGGAVLAGTLSSHEPGFEAKASRELPSKEAIARTAAGLVMPGSAIALSAGTTTWLLAQHLLEVPSLTVVTNSLRVAETFAAVHRHDTTLILTGGVRTPSDALVGPVADLAIRSLHFDVLFLGCHGIDPDAGLTTPNLAESETNRAFVRSARRVVVTADHTKWGTVGLSSFADLDEVDTLVIDPGLPPDARAVATERIRQVVLVDDTAAAVGLSSD
ncbi:MAG: DeoR/GlpR family DNA-binding transcription regulator [Mycobacteriales bacterium]